VPSLLGLDGLYAGGSAGNELKAVDVEAVVAWKSGLFHFDRDNIKTVMWVLARWYDVDV